MTKQTVFLSILLLFQILGYGQEYSESKEYTLTKYDSKLLDFHFPSNSEFDGSTKIHIIDNKDVKYKSIDVFVESYENNSKVEEFVIDNFKNVNKVIRVVIDQCACYCNTSKYYFLVTKNKELIELPTIEQEDYEFKLRTKDYVFNEKTNTIELTEFQDEMITKNDEVTFLLKSKKVLKTYAWNGYKVD